MTSGPTTSRDLSPSKASYWEYFRCLSCDTSQWLLRGDTWRGVEILDGMLQCGGCSTSVPIKGGIPRFVRGENYSQSFGFQWNEYRRTQLDSYTGLPISYRRVREASGWPPDLSGQVVLEAGSGAGRFTEVLLGMGAEVFSFDYSSAVEANLTNNGASEKLRLFQADILDIPVRRGAFDKVLCLGVLQHTPDPERAFKSLVGCLRPGGQIVVDCYAKHWRSLLHWKYLLRPLTTHVPRKRLHAWITNGTPKLLPVAAMLRRHIGSAGVRLLPILEYSHLGLSPEVAREWAILDTFDMYSPAHDHPQSAATLLRWVREAGLVDAVVVPGWNGFIVRGRRQNSEL